MQQDYVIGHQYTEVPLALNYAAREYLVQSGMRLTTLFEATKPIAYSCRSADELVEGIQFSPVQNLLSKAIVSCSETHVTFDARLLDALGPASLSPDLRKQDGGACGIIKVGFVVDSADYDDHGYSE